MSLVMYSKLEQLFKQNLTDIAQAKEEGRKVVGFYCLYSPVELAIAAGAIPVSLCGTKNDPIEAAEKVLPRNLCPLIKSSYGFALTDTCPYFRASDLVVGETTCDGKKKMFELLATFPADSHSSIASESGLRNGIILLVSRGQKVQRKDGKRDRGRNYRRKIIRCRPADERGTQGQKSLDGPGENETLSHQRNGASNHQVQDRILYG